MRSTGPVLDEFCTLLQDSRHIGRGLARQQRGEINEM